MGRINYAQKRPAGKLVIFKVLNTLCITKASNQESKFYINFAELFF